jgi:hypothetical protein
VKNYLTFLCIASMTAAIGAPGARAELPDQLPELVTRAPDYVFTPQGFDNNDNAQITISGELPNTCWKTGMATATVDSASKTIVVHNRSWVYSSSWCLDVTVPYTETINVGILPAGTYRVLVKQSNDTRILKSVMIVGLSATSSPDDYLYAQVEDLRIEAEPEGSSKKLSLSGTLASSCMELSEIRVVNRPPNVIEVLPIVSIVDGTNCDGRRPSFMKEISLTPPWKGTTLIHVRSLNGKSLNKVTEL